MDGWQSLIILPITLPLRQHRARYHSTTRSPLLYRQSSTARRSESLRRFNYSPGEDDSRWLNSLEKEEEEEEEDEDEKQRRRGLGSGKEVGGGREESRTISGGREGMTGAGGGGGAVVCLLWSLAMRFTSGQAKDFSSGRSVRLCTGLFFSFLCLGFQTQS